MGFVRRRRPRQATFTSPATPDTATARCFPPSRRATAGCGWRCCRSAPTRRAGSCASNTATPRRRWLFSPRSTPSRPSPATGARSASPANPITNRRRGSEAAIARAGHRGGEICRAAAGGRGGIELSADGAKQVLLNCNASQDLICATPSLRYVDPPTGVDMLILSDGRQAT